MWLISSCCYTAATLQLAGAAGSKRHRRWSRGSRLGWRLSADPLDLNSKRYEVKGFHLMSAAFRGLFWSLPVSYFRPHRHCLTRPPRLGAVEQAAPVPVCVFMVFLSIEFGIWSFSMVRVWTKRSYFDKDVTLHYRKPETVQDHRLSSELFTELINHARRSICRKHTPSPSSFRINTTI